MTQTTLPKPADTQAALDDLLSVEIETPAYVICEDNVRANVRVALAKIGDPCRFVPHVKTHRAPWVVRLLIEEGVRAVKCATVREAAMAIEAGISEVVWACPTVNPAAIDRFVALAGEHPDRTFRGLVESQLGLELWASSGAADMANLALYLDLDTGLGRTGCSIEIDALVLARACHKVLCLAGVHVYDGDIRGDMATKRAKVEALAARIHTLQRDLRAEGLPADLLAGTSHTFDIWADGLSHRMSGGSFIYSNAPNDRGDLGVMPAAFVLSTVICAHGDAATLDAGSKAISPDQPLAQRFGVDGEIRAMSEEHTVVTGSGLTAGQKVLLVPQHTCTTSYLYSEAIVVREGAAPEVRPQLGNQR